MSHPAYGPPPRDPRPDAVWAWVQIGVPAILIGLGLVIRAVLALWGWLT